MAVLGVSGVLNVLGVSYILALLSILSLSFVLVLYYCFFWIFLKLVEDDVISASGPVHANSTWKRYHAFFKTFGYCEHIYWSLPFPCSSHLYPKIENLLII